MLQNTVLFSNVISQKLRHSSTDNYMFLYSAKGIVRFLPFFVRKKQQLESTISTDNSSLKDNNLALSNAAHVLHWDYEGHYGNALSVVF